MKASLFGIPTDERSLALLAAALLLAAISPASAHPRHHGESDGAMQTSDASRPGIRVPLTRAGVLRTRRAPNAGNPPSPRLGTIPSVAGGIPRLNVSGFAPGAPFFNRLQPEQPAIAPWPRKGGGHHAGRGRGDRGHGDRGHGDMDSSQSCTEKSSGVSVWRGQCED